uniref:Bromo domain-containing protein n=1 Tax=Dendroctonus ponderosae TaxID=77166 RepID=A0AAR5NYI6_DENPD
MVNTRRSESHSGHHHRTRGSTKLVEDQDSGSTSAKEKDSDSDRTNSDDETSSNSPLVKPQSQLKKKPVEPKVSTKVVTIQREFETKFNTTGSTRNTHKQISLERRRLAVYASRKMEDELLENTNFSEGEYYKNPRTHRQNRLTKKTRMLRRSALSLRPIRQKCYADHSASHMDTDSDIALPSSTRRPRNIEGSWLADSQMHKVGYPNMNVEYSEEDSRDVPDENTQRATRHSRRMTKPGYYYEAYDDSPTIARRTRRSGRRVVRMVHTELTNSDSNNKENKEDEKPLKTRSSKTERNTDEDSKSSKDVEVDDIKQEEVKEPGMEEKITQQRSGSEEQVTKERVTARRNTRQSRLRIRQNINHERDKETESESLETEEDEGGRKYSLRNRPLKAAPKAMQTYVLRERRSRRIFTRRRRKSSSSSDSSSSSEDRFRKTPKNQHMKKEMLKTGAGGPRNIEPIKPEMLDQSVRFSSIGGLQNHIQCLKEMILLPMMYPEVFKQFQVQPPRGVLFHGPPGTGKTLIARALANESSFGNRKVAFFMMKGGELLSKWLGESEKQLRTLFEQAAEMKPSIIFFDELDGLAPIRSSRQDQVHASIVSTLLALMDGLSDRGEVIVIGATNRIDAIDPALRRPGRFDRELFFPLPSKTEREDILKVHVAKWSQPPSDELVGTLAESTVGYCGSDLRALCSEAVIQSFRRTYPQVYNSDHRLLLQPESVKVNKVDFLRAKSMLVPASHRVASGLGKKLLNILEPLLGPVIKNALDTLEQTFPHGLNSSLAKVKLSASLRPAQLLLAGDGAQHGQSNHIGPDLLFRMEHIHPYLLDLATLYREPGRLPEEACIQIFNEARKNVPSIIYIPNIDRWWKLASDTVKAIYLSQLKEIDPNVPILILAAADVSYNQLPKEIRELFSHYRKEIQEVSAPKAEARRQFFRNIIDICLRPIREARDRPVTPPSLPREDTPPPIQLTEEQAQKLYETEEHTLRELRIFLRDMCKKLANNKLFFMFTKPVDTEEVPDYTEIIKQPMDLETMMTKVDFHRYECAKDFLQDIDLICENALEYNPANKSCRSSADKQIRHRACSLRDYAYTLIKTEMDSDFEDKCQDIKKQRKQRKACTAKYLPSYMITPNLQQLNLDIEEKGSVEIGDVDSQDTPDRSRNTISRIKKRRIRCNWQNGYLKRKSKRQKLDIPANKSKEKISSDESKNDPDSSTIEIPTTVEDASCKSVDTNTTLSINCDNHKEVSSSHMTRSTDKMSCDLLSPSELLDIPLYFDEIDQALHENGTEKSKPIECSETDLEKLLDQIVKGTEGFSLSQLLDLYNQFGDIIKKFSKTHIRHPLPNELLKEYLRFKKSCSIDVAKGTLRTY